MTQFVAGLCAILIAAIVSPAAVKSLAAGVVLMWVAVSYLLLSVWRLERQVGVPAKRITKAFYFGQLIKFIVLVAGVIILLKTTPMNWAGFIIGVMVVQVSGMLLTLDIKGKLSA